MRKQVVEFVKPIVVGILMVLGLLLYGIPVQAQSAQSTSSASDFFGSSGQSSFQNPVSPFQQSDNAAASTAGGSASALRQAATGPLSVSGAPANQNTTSANSSTAQPWLLVIFVTSVVGLIALYLYSKQSTAKSSVAEAEFAEEVLTQAKPKKSKKTATKKEESKTEKPKKTTKKKKNKKHHR